MKKTTPCPGCGGDLEALALEEYNRRMYERRAAGGRIGGKTGGKIGGKTGGKIGGKIAGNMKTEAQTAARKNNVQKMNAANTPEVRRAAALKGWEARRRKAEDTENE